MLWTLILLTLTGHVPSIDGNTLLTLMVPCRDTIRLGSHLHVKVSLRDITDPDWAGAKRQPKTLLTLITIRLISDHLHDVVSLMKVLTLDDSVIDTTHAVLCQVA